MPEQGRIPIVIGHEQVVTVDCEELDHGERGGPLVAVVEAVVLLNREAQPDRERQDIDDLLIPVKILRAEDHAFDEAPVLIAGQPAMSVDLFVGDGFNVLEREPKRLTVQGSAASFRTARRSPLADPCGPRPDGVVP